MEASQAARTVLARLDFVLQNFKLLFVVYLKPVRQVVLDVVHVFHSPFCSTHGVAVRVDGQVARQLKTLHARVLDVPNVQKLVDDH